MKLPLEISQIIDFSDPVYTFAEVMNHVDLIWNLGFLHFGCFFTAPCVLLFCYWAGSAGRYTAVPRKLEVQDALPDICQQEILQTHDTDAVFIPRRKAIQRNHIFGIVIGNLQQIVCLAG